MTKPNGVQLYHSGDLGDVVYAIPALRRLAFPAHLTLYPNPGVTRTIMDEGNADLILPLLNSQRGVTADWKPNYGADGLRMDFAIRRFYHCGMNLADIHSNWVGHDHWNTEMPWLIANGVTPHPYKIVVSRSARYRNDSFRWKDLHAQFKRHACFIGVPWEHADFVNHIGPIDFVETTTLLDVAKVIVGADLFIGNQSCPRAIAEGLKVPVIVEHGSPENTHFARECAWYPGHGAVPDISELVLSSYWARAASMRALGRSVYPQNHLQRLAEACYAVRNLPGHGLEIGVGKGGSAAVIAWCLQRPLHLVDYLEQSKDAAAFLRVYDFKLSTEGFQRFSADPNAPDSLAFVHIDTGSTTGIGGMVTWADARLVDGGVIVISGVRATDPAIQALPRKFESIGFDNLSYYVKQGT